MPACVCIVPVSPVRKEPSHKSEMISQILFGEDCIIEEQQSEWVRIRSLFDEYSGWVTRNQFQELPFVPASHSFNYTTDWTSKISRSSQALRIPMGCPTEYFPALDIADNLEIWNAKSEEWDEANLKRFAFAYLNTAYLWGGRSVFGVDCSGYSQAVFKLMGIVLPRDAWMQAEGGVHVNSLEEAHCGDLAFFENEKGHITHVGILIGGGKIVHAAGRVRIDKIDFHGIINHDTGELSHRFRLIRRYRK